MLDWYGRIFALGLAGVLSDGIGGIVGSWDFAGWCAGGIGTVVSNWCLLLEVGVFGVLVTYC